MATPQPPQGPGRQRINRGLAGAAGVAGAAPQFIMGRAAGMSVAGAAMSTAGGIVTTKVLGPAAALSAIMLGVLKTTIALVKQTEIYSRGIERAASVEKIESGFTAIYRSAQRAKQEVKSLLNFAATTPFRYDSILEAAKTLTMLTRGGYSGAAAMKRVGDVAAASSTDIREASFWIGKLYNFMQQGRSVQGLLFRMQDLGIVSGQLANELERLEAQGGSFLQKWSAVESEFRKSEGAMKEESRSLDGLRTRLERTIQTMEKGFGDNFLEQEKNATYATIKLYEQFSPVLQTIGRDVADVTGVVRGFTTELKGSWVEAARLGDVAKGVWTVFKGLAAGIAAIAVGRTFATLGSGLARVATGRTTMQAVGRASRASAAAGAGSQRREAASGMLKEAIADFATFQIFAGAEKLAGSIKEGGKAYAERIKDTAARTRAGQATAARTGGLASRLLPVSAVGEKAAIAWVVFRDAISKVGTALTRVFGWVSRMVLGIGFLNGALMAVGAASLHFYNLSKRMEQAAKANNDLSISLTATSRALQEQVKSVKTLADYHDALAVATKNLSDAQDRLANYKKEGLPAADLERRAILEGGVRQAKSDLNIAKRRGGQGFLRTTEQAQADAQRRREREASAFSNDTEFAEGATKSALMRRRASELGLEATKGEELISAERRDRWAPQAAELASQRTQAQNDVARAEALKDQFKESPTATRDMVRGQLETEPLTEADRAELASMTAKFEEHAKYNIGPAFDAEGQKKFERLQARASGLKPKPGQEFTQAEIDARIQQSIAQGDAGKAQIKAIDEQIAAGERTSDDPLVRARRDMEDLAAAGSKAEDPRERGFYFGQADAKQQEIAEMQLDKESAVGNRAASEQLTNQAAKNDLDTGNFSRDIAAQKEIRKIRDEGLAADVRAGEIRQKQLDAELAATREFAKQANGGVDDPNDPRVLAAQNAAGENEKQTDVARTALAISRQQHETEMQIAKLRGQGLAHDIKANEIRMKGAKAELDALLAAGKSEDDEGVMRSRESIAGLENERRGMDRSRLEAAMQFNDSRRAAELTIAGDTKGAQAERDQSAIRDRATNYAETFGMSAEDAEKQARSDYFKEEAAAAMDQGPRITADSLQAIGGGGNATGFDPMTAIAERNAKAAEMSLGTLVEIKALLGGQQPTPMQKAGYQ
jgi:hypothetical protein